MTPYCTCSYYEADGTVAEGQPCAIHPDGCEHGKRWNEPCMTCRDKTWGVPERIYSPGHNCAECTSPGECDVGGCQYENDEISTVLEAQSVHNQTGNGK